MARCAAKYSLKSILPCCNGLLLFIHYIWKTMEKFFLALTAVLLVACSSPTPTTPDQKDSVKPNPSEGNMVIDMIRAEEPQGTVTYTGKESNNFDETFSWLIKGDSLVYYAYITDTVAPKKYWEVYVSTAALKDIDPSQVYASDDEYDDVDGSKKHDFRVFVKSQEEKDSFDGRTYSCMRLAVEQNKPYERRKSYLLTIRTKSMEEAKKLEATIKAALK
jgi:hypothetical protein